MSDAGTRRVALVTGSSRGIGRAIAVALGQAGWCVVVNYNSAKSAAEEVAQEIRDAGSEAVTVRANVANEGDRDRLLAATRELGRLHVHVNNAGMAPRQRLDLLETSEESFDEVMAVNLRGPFFLTQAAARLMVDAVESGDLQRPKIINIGSLSAYTSSPNRGEYCISKAGIAMMTKLFADRLAAHEINVYEVRPGIIETDMTSVVKGKYDAMIEAGLTPIPRWGTADDVARAVLAIAEDRLPFSTGEVINVDGGFHFRRL
jgi:3-oxoacyl-[acyl-carrier protein] reductase